MTSTHTSARFAVVGGGISGLAAAHRLYEAGHRVDLIEAEATLGGRMGFDMLGERPIMVGGKNIGRRYTQVRAFVAAMGGAEYEQFGINSSQIIDGELITLDNPGVTGLVRHLLRIGTPADVVKMLYYGMRVRLAPRNRYLGSPYFTRLGATRDQATLDTLFTPGLGRHALRPMSLRLNAAEPNEVYPGAFGVHLGMVMDHYDQLVHGFQPIVEDFASRITVRLDTRVDGIVLDGGRLRGLRLSSGAGACTRHDYDGVVLATPAFATARIIADDIPALSKLLAEVAYFPSTVAVVEYDGEMFTSAVRSIAFDAGPCSAAGVYGIDDRHIVRYTFSGPPARPVPSEGVLGAWIDDAEKRVAEYLKTATPRRIRTRTRSWEGAHCAYLPDHGEFLSQVGTQVAAVPGLELAGDYLFGAQLEACFRSGAAAARRLHRGG
ncbi:FAD-dependent oxidoreductase [Nocardia sp. NPDC005366]|uniref:FAD-dependent oxidoreductase n=1 Tax=Nocardia sp. NPDC005366 TaxID=3156878 RepID=UPI0033A011FA